MPTNRDQLLNTLWIATGILGIVLTYLFQDFTFLEPLNVSDESQFIIRKTFRVVLNDVFMLMIINAWFRDWKVTRLAIVIQVIDGVVLLPVYLIIKLSMEGTTEISSPLFSQFHRLIINPTLMILLIPAVYFQKFSSKG